MKNSKPDQKKDESAKVFKVAIDIQKAHLDELMRRQIEIPHDIFEVIKFVFEENVDFYKSISVLFKKNQLQSCLVLARIVMENSINLRYILKEDTEKRAKNFIYHSTTSFLNRLDNIEEEIPGKNEVIELLRNKESELQRSGKDKNRWDGKNFKQICDELGWGEIYAHMYTRLSKYVHSQYKGTRSLSEERPYNDFMKKFLSKDLLVLVLQTLKDINQKYNLQEGYVIISDYPKEGSDMVFSFSSKEVDEKMSKL